MFHCIQDTLDKTTFYEPGEVQCTHIFDNSFAVGISMPARRLTILFEGGCIIN